MSGARGARIPIPGSLRDDAPQLLGVEVVAEEVGGGVRVSVEAVRRDGRRRRQLVRTVRWADVVNDDRAAAHSVAP